MNIEKLKSDLQRLYDFIDGAYWASTMETERAFEVLREHLANIMDEHGLSIIDKAIRDE